MSGLPPYRVEWQLAPPGGAGVPITRWSGHDDAASARMAAIDALATGAALYDEVRIAAGATKHDPVASAISDADAIDRWDTATDRLPASKPDADWARQRERAGLRSAILMACRSAMARGVAFGMLSKAHAASALTLIALALDGEDPAKPLGPAD